MAKQDDHTAANKSLFLGIIICLLGATFYCYEFLLRIEPSVMMPQLMKQFNLTGGTLGILGSMYYWAYSPMQIGVGLTTDIYGPRRVLTLAVIVCTIGSFIFGHTESAYVAGFGRFLIGFGSAFAFVGVLKLAAIWLPPSWFAISAGFATALGMVGALVGDVQLSVLVHTIGWQETIYWSTVAGAVLVPIIWLVIRDTHPGHTETEERINFKEGLAGVFSIAKNPQMWLTGFIGCALYLSLSVFAEWWGIQFLEKVHNFTSKQASIANAMIFLGWLVGAPLFGLLSDLVRTRRWPLGLGCLISAAIILFVIYMPILKSHDNPVMIYSILFFFGLFSSAEIICFAIGRESCPNHMAGAAVSFVNMLVMLGGAVFQPLVGKLLDWGWDGQLVAGVRVFSVEDYRTALLIIPICLIFAGIGSVFLKDKFGQGEEG